MAPTLLGLTDPMCTRVVLAWLLRVAWGAVRGGSYVVASWTYGGARRVSTEGCGRMLQWTGAVAIQGGTTLVPVAVGGSRRDLWSAEPLTHQSGSGLALPFFAESGSLSSLGALVGCGALVFVWVAYRQCVVCWRPL